MRTWYNKKRKREPYVMCNCWENKFFQLESLKLRRIYYYVLMGFQWPISRRPKHASPVNIQRPLSNFSFINSAGSRLGLEAEFVCLPGGKKLIFSEGKGVRRRRVWAWREKCSSFTFMGRLYRESFIFQQNVIAVGQLKCSYDFVLIEHP